ncbi:putative polyketide synthase protein [Planotetraspora silvatica]|uniref:Putative polyketide synthase protein n=1 Tax=Planotetraspora silvatica TaxID=234614 RepID=A0A8J3UT58_9ACTN|nr:class I SAM-dependent methyltransferase [Planotetraspora silvatica]GII51549.1 putative polyketide synthase protein [Planotetraspora silvatica]
MSTERVHFTKEKATMLATLYGRARDSMSADPILGDRTAEELIERIDYDFGRFRMHRGWTTGVALRARQLDAWAADFLGRDPAVTVLHLGCGLDSRVFRLDPPSGVRWYDVDYPDVIAVRHRLYPDREGYRMIGTSVTDVRWLERIPAERPALVVAEGLLMYLSEGDIEDLFRGIADRFPSGQLMFDAISRLGVRLQRFNRPVRAAGATFTWALDDARLLERWDRRIRLVTELPVLDLPGVERLPVGYRIPIRAMRLVPAFRRVGRLLRYEFSRPR